jgi:hypothetical protein
VEVRVGRSVTVLRVTADGDRLVSDAGLGMLARVADMTGLTAGLASLFTVDGWCWRRHRRGVTIVRAACAVADGMTYVSQAALLCGSRSVRGAVVPLDVGH